MSSALTWREREPPLTAEAVFAHGRTALAFLRRLLEQPEILPELRCVADKGQLCVLGPTALLPWVDGVVYLGVEPGLPELWLPCFIQPSVDPSLLLRLLPRLGLPAPVALLPERGLALSLSAARSCDVDTLHRFGAQLKVQS